MNNDLKERLNEEVLRLSGYSIDRGSVDAGIAANLAQESLARIEQLESDLEKVRAALTAGEEAGGVNKPKHVGFIAHVDHGKTSLTAAITRLARMEPAPSPIVDDEMVERALDYIHTEHGSIRQYPGEDYELMRCALSAALSGAREGGEK